jgi:hypothetical protein
MESRILYRPFLFLLLTSCPLISFSQKTNSDSIVYRVTYRDTVIYRYDTVQIKRYVYLDTLGAKPVAIIPVEPHKRGVINRNNWGIGPSVGAYYSPFNGFDVNIGFGIQYYLFAVPSFRNPHLGHKRKQ